MANEKMIFLVDNTITSPNGEMNGSIRLVDANGNSVLPGAALTGTATFNPGSLVDGAGETTTVTVTGAALGNFTTATFSLDTQGITITSWVSAANTVSVRFQNETGGTIDLASGTLTARVTT